VNGDADAADVEAMLDELHTTPPSGFVARRTELATAAKEAGRAEDARRISGARRPTLSAWAANLLALARPDESRQFLELGQALREAHRTLDRAQLRELSAQQWRVIAAMSAQGAQLAAEAGHRLSDTARREVETTLRAVLADPDAAERWAAGRLQSALTPPATLPGAAGPTAPAAPARTARTPSTTTTRPRTKAARTPSATAAPVQRDDLAERRRAKEEQLSRARQDAKAAEQEVRAHRRKLASAGTAVDRARTRRERGQRHVDAAEERLRHARDQLAQDDEEVGKAEEQRRTAAAELARAERAARDAARAVDRLTRPRSR